MKEASENARAHTLNVVNREKCEITGIADVGLFHETMISAATDEGEITLAGQALHVDQLNLEKGVLIVTGRIDSIAYDDRARDRKSVLKRILR